MVLPEEAFVKIKLFNFKYTHLDLTYNTIHVKTCTGDLSNINQTVYDDAMSFMFSPERLCDVYDKLCTKKKGEQGFKRVSKLTSLSINPQNGEV